MSSETGLSALGDGSWDMHNTGPLIKAAGGRDSQHSREYCSTRPWLTEKRIMMAVGHIYARALTDSSVGAQIRACNTPISMQTSVPSLPAIAMIGGEK